MPTIRVDDDVYAWLQRQARPFEDSPNSVLRRVAGLDDLESNPKSITGLRSKKTSRNVPQANERVTGEALAKRWEVPVRHALYHRDGTFYENLARFPGGLFDPAGYVVFETAHEYKKSPYLQIGEKLNVPGGISRIPGYKRKPQ